MPSKQKIGEKIPLGAFGLRAETAEELEKKKVLIFGASPDTRHPLVPPDINSRKFEGWKWRQQHNDFRKQMEKLKATDGATVKHLRRQETEKVARMKGKQRPNEELQKEADAFAAQVGATPI